jgi:hypothetical protein
MQALETKSESEAELLGINSPLAPSSHRGYREKPYQDLFTLAHFVCAA